MTPSKEEYLKAKAIVEAYEMNEIINEQRRENEDYSSEEQFEVDDKCSVCGQIDGMDNPCCDGYDPLSYKNCGYG